MRVILKLLLFNGAVVAMYAVLGFVLHMDAVVEEFTEMGMWMLAAFIILLDICLFMYDRLLVPMTVLYANKFSSPASLFDSVNGTPQMRLA